MLGASGDGCNAERRRVACKQRLWLADAVELLENIALQLESFRCRFDDQRRVLAVFKTGTGTEAVKNFTFLFGRQLSPVAAAAQEASNTIQSRVDKFLLDVVHESFETGLCGNLSDPGAHRAGAEDGNLFSFVGHGPFSF